MKDDCYCSRILFRFLVAGRPHNRYITYIKVEFVLPCMLQRSVIVLFPFLMGVNCGKLF